LYKKNPDGSITVEADTNPRYAEIYDGYKTASSEWTTLLENVTGENLDDYNLTDTYQLVREVLDNPVVEPEVKASLIESIEDEVKGRTIVNGSDFQTTPEEYVQILPKGKSSVVVKDKDGNIIKGKPVIVSEDKDEKAQSRHQFPVDELNDIVKDFKQKQKEKKMTNLKKKKLEKEAGTELGKALQDLSINSKTLVVDYSENTQGKVVDTSLSQHSGRGNWTNHPGHSLGENWTNHPGHSFGGNWTNHPGHSLGGNWTNHPGHAFGGNWTNHLGHSLGGNWTNHPGHSYSGNHGTNPGHGNGGNHTNHPTGPLPGHVNLGVIDGRQHFVGPRGGHYYMNSNGNKTYINTNSSTS